jgi:hypothetical protein
MEFGYWRTDVIKQFYSSNFFFIKINFETPLGETELGLDQAGFRPPQVANRRSAQPRGGAP